ncbi:MAG TPA: CAP domain-containing protein [Mycobacteriales bacterium]|nr:CAP domain-containing protein [Mycobacteriales bacterium]
MFTRVRSVIVSVAVAGAVLAIAPAAHATHEPRCWLACTTPTTAPTPAPIPTYVQSAAPTPVLAPSGPVVMVSKPPRPQLTGGEVAELLSLINGHRRSKGISPVTLDGALSDVARQHTAVMISKNLLHHNDSLFTRAMHQRLGIKLFAENVGYGSGVADNHDGFLNSLHHRENMEGSAYTLVGLAVGRSSDGRIWVTENFGTPRIGGTAVAGPRPAAPHTTKVSAPVRAATTTVRRAAAPSAPSAPSAPTAAPRRDVAAAAPAVRLAPSGGARLGDDSTDVAAVAATPARASAIEFEQSTRTVPVGAAVAATLAAVSFLAIAPRRRRSAPPVSSL